MSATHTDAHGHDAHKPNHPYHLVDPSPWPMIGSAAAIALTVGMVLYMHGHGLSVDRPGRRSVLLVTLFLWWRDVVNEGEHQGHHTPVVQIGLRYGMALFIASEVMFFAAFFWAFFDASLFPKEAIGSVWPPQGIDDLRSVLAAAAQYADPADLGLHRHLGAPRAARRRPQGPDPGPRADRRARPLVHLGAGLRVRARAVRLQGHGVYASTFFMATGFHGFHVIVGTIFLLVCLIRSIKGHFTPDHHFGFEAAAWYWHFVDVVWLFLFIFVYIWGGANAPHPTH